MNDGTPDPTAPAYEAEDRLAAMRATLYEVETKLRSAEVEILSRDERVKDLKYQLDLLTTQRDEAMNQTRTATREKDRVIRDSSYPLARVWLGAIDEEAGDMTVDELKAIDAALLTKLSDEWTDEEMKEALLPEREWSVTVNFKGYVTVQVPARTRTLAVERVNEDYDDCVSDALKDSALENIDLDTVDESDVEVY